MFYAFLGSTLLGALSTALLLWRKSVVEKRLAESEAAREAALDASQRVLSELGTRTATFEDQLSRQREQVDTLRKQRDEAIDQLAKSATPGSIGKLLLSKNVKTHGTT